jgi:hypothetical protein
MARGTPEISQTIELILVQPLKQTKFLGPEPSPETLR